MEKNLSMCNENEILQAIQDIECKLKGAESAYTALGLEIDDLVDENREVFASTIGGLDKEAHTIIASYYDFKKQRDKVYLEACIAKGQIDALYKMLYSSCKYEKK